MTTLGGEYRDNRLRVFGRKIKIPKEETMLLVFDFFFFTVLFEETDNHFSSLNFNNWELILFKISPQGNPWWSCG